MQSNNDNDSSRPVTPLEDDCCHNDCNPCIFEVHNKLLEDYKRRKRLNIKTKLEKNLLHLSLYRSFIVNDIKEVAENYFLLSLQYEDDETHDATLLISPGQYVLLNCNKITRPYTPITWNHKSIDFLIKLYPNGKFSTLIKDTKIGDKINIRGPYGNFKYIRNSFQQIIMFSIGSGIAAIYPIAKAIIYDELEETKIHFIGGFQRVSQVPLKKELQNLSNYWNFQCTLYISQPLDDTQNVHGIQLKQGRLSEQSVFEVLQLNRSNVTLILVCGTHQFNRSIEQWTRDMHYTHIHVFE